MNIPWTAPIALALTAVVVGPAMAQGTGSGTTAPGKAGSPAPGAPTSSPPRPSPTQPGSPAPGTGSGAPGKASPGVSQSDSGKIGGSQGTTGSGAAASGARQMGSGASGTGAVSGTTGGSEQVKSVQKALQEKGMDPGPIDGVMGPKTQGALRSFQKDQKLPETGRLDDQTRQKLGINL